MSAVFAELDIEHMVLADGAMRQGILYDMLGRLHQHDMRDVTVRQFMQRYHVDAEPGAPGRAAGAEAVRATCRAAARTSTSTRCSMLSWAARLHEIGMSVAYSGYHKHSAYIVAQCRHAGLLQDGAGAAVDAGAGASRLARQAARAGRGQDDDWSLLVALRLAALIHRSRSEVRLPAIHASRKKSTFTMESDARWLAANPLTAAELRDEITRLEGPRHRARRARACRSRIGPGIPWL